MWTVAAYWRTHSPSHWFGLRVGIHLTLSLHTSNEPSELSQWLWATMCRLKHHKYHLVIIITHTNSRLMALCPGLPG